MTTSTLEKHSRSSAKFYLIERLKNKTASIGVVGLGYVGLPLALAYSNKGYRTVGLDVDAQKVLQLNSGKTYIEHIPSTEIQAALKQGFQATADMSVAGDLDALILCVPTPLNKYREPDLSYIHSTMEALLPYLRKGQIVSLESTTYPGTTEEELKPRIESRGLTVGEDVFLVHSPERQDPGNPVFHTENIPKVCGGCTPACLEVGIALYGEVIQKVVPVRSTQAAELTKLLENIQRAVNIALMNELKTVADRMNIDIYEVIRAASTKPFGFMPYYPGPGIGGHCIPVDPFYLTWKAREFNVHTRFIELAGEVNNSMPGWVVAKTADALNTRSKALKGSRILVLGVAYKKNVDDLRESPVLTILDLLADKGARVDYSDPHIPTITASHGHKLSLKSVPVTAETLAQYDCVLIGTNHDRFDFNLIKRAAPLIVDTRGTFTEHDEKIIRA